MEAAENHFINLALVIALGFIIGLERGWSQRDGAEGSRFAGLRTFMLIAVLGGLAAIFDDLGQRAVALALMVAFAGVMLAVALRPRAPGEHGITTIIAALITFAVGFLAAMGVRETAAALAVVTAVILGMKQEIHQWLRTIERVELSAVLKFLVISIIVLPLLPDRGFGPWDSLNPYQLWWMVVLITAISYVGYFTVKWAGPRRGIILTALAGGLASSTAIAVSFSRLGKRAPGLAPLFAAGIVASSTMMLPRILLVSLVVAPPLAERLWPVLAAAAVAGGLVVWRIWPEHSTVVPAVVEEAGLKSSFDLWLPLRFGVAVAGVMLLAAAARAFIGDEGLYYVAALAGLTDVDALTLTAAREFAHGLTLAVAGGAVLIAALVNSLTKVVITRVIGGADMLRRVVPAFIAMIAAGGLVLLIQSMF